MSSFEHLNFGILNLFRIWCLGFRVFWLVHRPFVDVPEFSLAIEAAELVQQLVCRHFDFFNITIPQLVYIHLLQCLLQPSELLGNLRLDFLLQKRAVHLLDSDPAVVNAELQFANLFPLLPPFE